MEECNQFGQKLAFGLENVENLEGDSDDEISIYRVGIDNFRDIDLRLLNWIHALTGFIGEYRSPRFPLGTKNPRMLIRVRDTGYGFFILYKLIGAESVQTEAKLLTRIYTDL